MVADGSFAIEVATTRTADSHTVSFWKSFDGFDDEARRGFVLQQEQFHPVSDIPIELLGDLVGILEHCEFAIVYRMDLSLSCRV